MRSQARLGAFVAVAMTAGAVLSSGAARAEEDACLTAPVDGQKLQRAGKLLAAHDRFAVCAVHTCPAEVVDACVRWLRRVDEATPSVVLAARDGGGHDLLDVQVSVDGKPPADLSTQAIRLDPGPHTFVFARSGRADVRSEAVLREGEKNREILASFVAPSGAPAATPQVDGSGGDRPVPAMAWVAGGIGAVGIAGFAIFGALGVSERGADHCDSGCPSSQKSDVDSKYLIANISLGVGVVALAVATWLYLSRPAAEPQSSALVHSPGFVGLSF